MLLPKPRPKLLDKRDEARAKLKAWTQLRARVLVRWQGKCRICLTKRAYDVHHVLARSLGGRDEYTNLIPVCRGCHTEIHGHVVTLRWLDDRDRASSLRITRAS